MTDNAKAPVKKKAKPPAKKKQKGWVKGQSGNPKGRPKGSLTSAVSIRKAVERACLESVEEDIPRLWKQALKEAETSPDMLKWVLDKFIHKASESNMKAIGGTGGIVINVQSLDQVEAIDAKPIEGEVVNED